MRCGQGSVLQCDKVCGALLNCAEHTCAQVCHSGACQPCQLQVQQGESHFASAAPGENVSCSGLRINFLSVFIFFSLLL